MPERSDRGRAGEFELIARHFAPLAEGFAGAFGLGDDTARFAARAGTDLVVTTDTLVAGVHFLASDPPATIGQKTLRVSLSDLAAAGASPLAYQLSTAWPSDISEAWIADFVRGLAADQRRFGIVLCGGDTVGTPGPMTLTVTAFGSVEQNRGLGRAGARPGDRLLVSGTIGDGLLGLRALRGELETVSAEERAYVIDRYRLPRPRSELGPRLVGVASACIDVSDGLVADLGHLCRRSGCAARLEIAKVPLSPGARSALAHDGALLTKLLAGGDDYELLFAVPPEKRDRALATLATADVPLTEIGHFAAGEGVQAVGADGSPIRLAASGWQHF